MTIALLVLLALFVGVTLVVARSIAIVPQGSAFLVERLGRYDRTLSPGIAILFPFVDAVRARVSLAERTLELPAAAGASLDGRAMTLSGTVVYRVVDPRRAVYDVADYEQAIASVAARMLAQVVSEVDAVHALAAVKAAADRARPAVAAWGVDIGALDAVVTVAESDDVWRLAARGPSGGARLARAAAVIAPGATGLVEDGGRLRAARNVSGREIARGATCRVQDEEGDVVLVISETN